MGGRIAEIGRADDGVTPDLFRRAGGDEAAFDQDAEPGYVQQYSLDWQRELPGQMAISFGYMGSRSERLSLGGTSDTTLNINQLLKLSTGTLVSATALLSMAGSSALTSESGLVSLPTTAAVTAFQKDKGLTEDGVAGPTTLTAINSALAAG